MRELVGNKHLYPELASGGTNPKSPSPFDIISIIG